MSDLAVPGTTGITGFFQSLLTGFPLSGGLGYATLLFLTVFPVTGIAGLNLVAVGEPAFAFMKFISCALSVVLMTFLAPYWPILFQGSWMIWIAGLGPWYIFDILQMVDYSNFQVNGFESLIPIPGIPSGGGKNGSWRLTSTFLNLFLGTIAASGQVLPALFPNTSIAGVSSTTIGNTISIAGGSALGISAAASLLTLALAPNVAPAGVIGSASGVAGLRGGGNSLPPLSTFADRLAEQSAGGERGDGVFLAFLSFIAVVGIFLGFTRSKQ